MQGFTPNTDFSELHSTMRAIELASNSIQVSSYSSPFLIILYCNRNNCNAQYNHVIFRCKSVQQLPKLLYCHQANLLNHIRLVSSFLVGHTLSLCLNTLLNFHIPPCRDLLLLFLSISFDLVVLFNFQLHARILLYRCFCISHLSFQKRIKTASQQLYTQDT